MLAGLVLFGVIRRTLGRRGLAAHVTGAATGLSLAATLLWIVHPLQTEAVTYLIQRGESLASLFYLLTLYALIRGADSSRARQWYAAAVVFCLLGMATKPVVVTAPLMALIYDRVFLSRSFRRLRAERGWLHVALFATAGVIPALLAAAPMEWRSSSGLETPGIGPADYVMTEPGVLVHYLRLCVWPHPLCLDYGWPVVTGIGQAVPSAIAIGALLAGTAFLFLRGNALGFLGSWFFLILAPTSSFVPLLDPAFEHRLYLPLAAVTTLAVLGGHTLLRALAWSPARRRVVSAGVVAALVVGAGALTLRRNADYRSAVTIWSDTVAKRPAHLRARVNLALVLAAEGRRDEAMAQLVETLRRDPGYAWAHHAVGYLLAQQGRFDEALPHLKLAAGRLPMSADVQLLLGTVYSERGELGPAIRYLSEAVRLEPWRAEAHNNLGAALNKSDRVEEAVPYFMAALRLNPDYPNAHFNLGLARMRVGETDEARREFEATLAIRPGHPQARAMLDSLARAASQ
jgi:Flp pilus assembly protein TadD